MKSKKPFLNIGDVDRQGAAAGHRGLHVARADPRQESGQPLRSVWIRIHALREGDRKRSIQRRDGRRRRQRHHP